MSTILRKGTVQGGQIVIEEPMDLPDGSEVTILGRSTSERPQKLDDIVFMTEEQQSDDPEAINMWIADLQSIPPVPSNPAKNAEWQAWEERLREYNVEAMRKQFIEGTS